MVNLLRIGFSEYERFIKGKEVYVYGAGRALESCIDIYFNNTNVKSIIDRNKELWGKKKTINGKKIDIISLGDFINQIKRKEKNNIVIFITTTFYVIDIIEELNKYKELDNINCLSQVVIRNIYEKIEPYSFTIGKQLIPKKIHYIWIGNKELPDSYKRNIETWEKYNPDYEIIRWDESNYDFKKCDYMREAYEAKCWGFVPNYCRLDIVNRYGGIYLDIDVECKGSFDAVLNDKAFFSMGSSDRINNGCGFGSKPNIPFLSELKKQFEDNHFLNKNGIPQKTPCHIFLHPIFRKHGFIIENRYQKVEDIVLYPTEVFSPLTIDGWDNYLSNNTLSIHKEDGTWKNKIEREGVVKIKKYMSLS